MNTPSAIALPNLGILSITGPDAALFLQGQLSNDALALAAKSHQLTSLNSAKGRVLAFGELHARADGFDWVIAGALVESIATHLNRFKLRANIDIDCNTNAYPVGQIIENHHTIVLSNENPATDETATNAFEYGYYIESKLPKINEHNSDRFTAHQLGISDRAVSFSKGCYVGQEVIARTEHLGKVKRTLATYVYPNASTQEAMQQAFSEAGLKEKLISTLVYEARTYVQVVASIEPAQTLMLKTGELNLVA